MTILIDELATTATWKANQSKKAPTTNPRPSQPRILSPLHILPNLNLPLINRNGLRSLQLRHIGAKLRKNRPLHSRLDSSIDDFLVRFDFRDGGHVDDCILVFERWEKFGFGIVVRDAMDLDV